MEGEKEELEFDVSVPDNSTLEGCFSPTYYRRHVLVIKVAWCLDTLRSIRYFFTTNDPVTKKRLTNRAPFATIEREGGKG